MFTVSLVVLAALALLMCLSPGLVDLQELRDRRKAALDECEGLEKKAKAENRDELTVDEKKTVDERMAEFDKLTIEIDAGLANRGRTDRLQAARDKMAAPEPLIAPLAQPTTEPRLDLNQSAAIPIPYREMRCFTGPTGPAEAYRFGRWCMGMLLGHTPSQEWCRNAGVDVSGRMVTAESRALSTGVNTAGGYMIPEEFGPRLIRLVEVYGVFRQNSFIDPMARDTKIIARGIGRLTPYFVGEGEAPTETEPTFGQNQLTAKLLAALIRMSNEVAEDAIIDLGDYIATEVAYAFALKEDQCGFLGDGTSTYGGMFGVFPKIDDGTHTATIYTALAGNTAFSTLDLVDFEGALGQLPQYAVPGARWYISRVGFYACMARLMDAAGGNTKDDIAGGTGLQFLGIPVVISQVCNTTTAAQINTVVCVVGDLRQASTFGDRRELGLMVSEHRYMELGQIGIRATERFDIVVHDLGDTSVAGPLVGLKTPAA